MSGQVESSKISEAGDGAAAVIPQSPEQNASINNFEEAKEEHKWYKLNVSGEIATKMAARVGHALVCCNNPTKLYMLGGGNHSGDLKEVWTLDVSAETLDGLTGEIHTRLTEEFPGIYEFSFAPDKERNEVWIFGGASSDESFNDVYAFNLDGEQIVRQFSGEEGLGNFAGGDASSGNVPRPRTQGNNSCYLTLKGDDYLAVFGGGQRAEKAVSDGNLYLFNITTKTWEIVNVTGMTPKPVQGHAMASIGARVFLHGGMDNFEFSDELYMIDLEQDKPKWCKIEMVGPRPSARAAHGAVAIDNCFYLCAGVGIDGALMDVWKYNTEALEWTCLNHVEVTHCVCVHESHQHPAPRTDFAMTVMTVNKKPMLLIHGGMNTIGDVFNDFWVYTL